MLLEVVDTIIKTQLHKTSNIILRFDTSLSLILLYVL